MPFFVVLSDLTLIPVVLRAQAIDLQEKLTGGKTPFQTCFRRISADRQLLCDNKDPGDHRTEVCILIFVYFPRRSTSSKFVDESAFQTLSLPAFRVPRALAAVTWLP